VKLYPEDTPTRFEFHKIAEKVAAGCRTERARIFAKALQPMHERDVIERYLEQTHEAQSILDNGVYFPDYSFPNVAHELGMLAVSNAVLEGPQVIKLRKVAEVAATVIRFLGEKREFFPSLREIMEGLHASKDLMALIDRLLEPNGFVKSSASKELADARKSLGEARQKANKAFEAAVRKYKRLGWLRK
jgi:DNA mismatch repair protein MutS2